MQRTLLSLSFLFSTVASFKVVKQTQTAEKLSINDAVTLTCKTDDYYEYCAWRHSGGSGQGLRECHFEWKRKHGAVRKQECHDDLRHKVSISGNYERHECGLKIENVTLEDAGRWICEMEEYRLIGGKGSGKKSKKYFRVEVQPPTTTTTTTTAATTTTATEGYLDYPNYLDGAKMKTTEENRVTEDHHHDHENDPESSEDHDHHGHEYHYDSYEEEYTETSEEGLRNEELLHNDDEDPITAGEDHNDDHEIREHSEAMTEHEYLDHDWTNETYIESSRLHVDQAEARDSQLIENSSSSSAPVAGIVVGVLVAVLAAAGVVTGVLIWRRRRTTAGVVTMSKILEDSEARGSILDETEVIISTL